MEANLLFIRVCTLLKDHLNVNIVKPHININTICENTKPKNININKTSTNNYRMLKISIILVCIVIKLKVEHRLLVPVCVFKFFVYIDPYSYPYFTALFFVSHNLPHHVLLNMYISFKNVVLRYICTWKIRYRKY